MTTTEDVARAALGSLNVAEHLLHAANWVNERYQDLASRAKFRHLRRVGTLSATGLARYHLLEPRARWISDILVVESSRHIITSVSLELLDLRDPGRLITSHTRPYHFAEVGSDLNNDGKECKRIEIYPPFSTTTSTRYVYYELPADVSELTSHIPPEIDLAALKEGVLIDVMRFKMAMAADAGQQQMAEFWRNEMRTQQTVWELKVIPRAIQSDRAVDDATFIMSSLSRHGRRGDINDGYSHVYARGNRP